MSDIDGFSNPPVSSSEEEGVDWDEHERALAQEEAEMAAAGDDLPDYEGNQAVQMIRDFRTEVEGEVRMFIYSADAVADAPLIEQQAGDAVADREVPPDRSPRLAALYPSEPWTFPVSLSADNLYLRTYLRLEERLRPFAPTASAADIARGVATVLDFVSTWVEPAYISYIYTDLLGPFRQLPQALCTAFVAEVVAAHAALHKHILPQLEADAEALAQLTEAANAAEEVRAADLENLSAETQAALLGRPAPHAATLAYHTHPCTARSPYQVLDAVHRYVVYLKQVVKVRGKYSVDEDAEQWSSEMHGVACGLLESGQQSVGNSAAFAEDVIAASLFASESSTFSYVPPEDDDFHGTIEGYVDATFPAVGDVADMLARVTAKELSVLPALAITAREFVLAYGVVSVQPIARPTAPFEDVCIDAIRTPPPPADPDSELGRDSAVRRALPREDEQAGFDGYKGGIPVYALRHNPHFLKLKAAASPPRASGRSAPRACENLTIVVDVNALSDALGMWRFVSQDRTEAESFLRAPTRDPNQRILLRSVQAQSVQLALKRLVTDAVKDTLRQLTAEAEAAAVTHAAAQFVKSFVPAPYDARVPFDTALPSALCRTSWTASRVVRGQLPICGASVDADNTRHFAFVDSLGGLVEHFVWRSAGAASYHQERSETLQGLIGGGGGGVAAVAVVGDGTASIALFEALNDILCTAKAGDKETADEKSFGKPQGAESKAPPPRSVACPVLMVRGDVVAAIAATKYVVSDERDLAVNTPAAVSTRRAIAAARYLQLPVAAIACLVPDNGLERLPLTEHIDELSAQSKRSLFSRIEASLVGSVLEEGVDLTSHLESDALLEHRMPYIALVPGLDMRYATRLFTSVSRIPSCKADLAELIPLRGLPATSAFAALRLVGGALTAGSGTFNDDDLDSDMEAAPDVFSRKAFAARNHRNAADYALNGLDTLRLPGDHYFAAAQLIKLAVENDVLGKRFIGFVPSEEDIQLDPSSLSSAFVSRPLLNAVRQADVLGLPQGYVELYHGAKSGSTDAQNKLDALGITQGLRPALDAAADVWLAWGTWFTTPDDTGRSPAQRQFMESAWVYGSLSTRSGVSDPHAFRLTQLIHDAVSPVLLTALHAPWTPPPRGTVFFSTTATFSRSAATPGRPVTGVMKRVPQSNEFPPPAVVTAMGTDTFLPITLMHQHPTSFEQGESVESCVWEVDYDPSNHPRRNTFQPVVFVTTVPAAVALGKEILDRSGTLTNELLAEFELKQRKAVEEDVGGLQHRRRAQVRKPCVEITDGWLGNAVRTFNDALAVMNDEEAPFEPGRCGFYMGSNENVFKAALKLSETLFTVFEVDIVQSRGGAPTFRVRDDLEPLPAGGDMQALEYAMSATSDARTLRGVHDVLLGFYRRVMDVIQHPKVTTVEGDKLAIRAHLAAIAEETPISSRGGKHVYCVRVPSWYKPHPDSGVYRRTDLDRVLEIWAMDRTSGRVQRFAFQARLGDFAYPVVKAGRAPSTRVSNADVLTLFKGTVYRKYLHTLQARRREEEEADDEATGY